jgi:hypothetical protein
MNSLKLALCLGVVGLTASVGHAQPASAAPSTAIPKELPPASTKQGLTFDKDIKPLFEASCVKCHGEQKPKGKLRLDSLEGFKAGSEDGPIYKEGDSANSSIVKAIARINPKTQMPPAPRKPRPGPDGQVAPQPEPPKPLTSEEVGLVRAWIDQGAK